MGVTGKRWCNFLVYTRDGVPLQRRLQILDAAEYFFHNHIAPELVHCITSGT